MSKKDVISVIAKDMGLTQKEIEKIYNVTIETMTEILADGYSFNKKNFGTFSVTKLDKRKGFNPLIKKWMMLPPKLKPKFKPSDKLKEEINNSPTTRIIKKG